jgi:hypothetical protein
MSVTYFPLLTPTRKPRIYDGFEYGGDNLIGFYQEVISPTSPLFSKLEDIKRRYQEAMSADAELVVFQGIENEYISYKNELFEEFKRGSPDRCDSDNHQHLLEVVAKNERKRLKIVEALGGVAFCETIPVIYPKAMGSYHYFNLKVIPEGHSYAQFEDFAGRKGIIIKVLNKKTNEIEVLWFNQRRRETELGIHPGLWLGTVEGRLVEGASKISKVIESIRNGTHENFKMTDCIQKNMDKLKFPVLDLDYLTGLPLSTAWEETKRRYPDIIIREVSADGMSCLPEDDLRFNRVNVSTLSGKIIVVNGIF